MSELSPTVFRPVKQLFSATVDAGKCFGCGQCAIVCPEEAVTMIETREPIFIP
jgi:ferredoxin